MVSIRVRGQICTVFVTIDANNKAKINATTHTSILESMGVGGDTYALV
jgi:hypothetical protein